jgi:Crp-like helix-turn-helix protein
VAQVEVVSRRPRLADGLPAAEAVRVAAILAHAESIELERSGRLFRNSLAGTALVAVEYGFVVARATFLEPSRSIITCEAGPGRLVLPPAPGEVLCAIGTARLTPISPAARDELLTLPVVARRMVEQMTFTLGEKHEALSIFAQTRHVERVRRKLLQLARGYGHVVREGVRIDFPITHALLAQMIGSSRETVTRALEQLQRDGIVARHGSTYLLTGPVEVL